jgi:hypothetical protein
VVWANQVLESLDHLINTGDKLTILAGHVYRAHLTQPLCNLGYSVEAPLQGMSIGRQIQWLNQKVARNQSDLNTFYEIMTDLEIGMGGKRKLAECDGNMHWPRRGVYFFFEADEFRRAFPKKLRVVRVGTHAVSRGSHSTLWDRLRAHKGSSDNAGNHRSSIFRLHLGEAIMNKEGSRMELASWGEGMFANSDTRAGERSMEVRVSRYLSEMPFLWIAVDDIPSPGSDRAYIEKNTIALLSNFENPLDPPSKEWLGNYSPSTSIRQSGLWNIQHTTEKYDPRFLRVLSEYVSATLGRRRLPRKSIAPKT